MLIQVENRWTYNAPNTIHIGDMVELPSPSGLGSFEGRVTTINMGAAIALRNSGYDGPIKAIIGRSEPMHVEVTARTKRELLEKIRDLIEDIEDES